MLILTALEVATFRPEGMKVSGSSRGNKLRRQKLGSSIQNLYRSFGYLNLADDRLKLFIAQATPEPCLFRG